MSVKLVLNLSVFCCVLSVAFSYCYTKSFNNALTEITPVSTNGKEVLTWLAKIHDCADDTIEENYGPIRFIRFRPGVTVLRNEAIKNLSSLTTLIFHDVGLKTIESLPFVNIPNIKSIFLSKNQLTKLPIRTFYDLPVIYIDLSDNNIETIDKKAFDKLPMLVYLFLQNNNLKVFNPTWFSKAETNIKVLNISTNHITQISNDYFYSFENLMYLNASNNSIQSVSKQAFANNAYIIILDLSLNLIKDMDAVQSLRHLKYLNLSFNKIMYLKPEMLKNLKSVQFIFLMYNPLKCSCYLEMVKETFVVEIFYNVNELDFPACVVPKTNSDCSNIYEVDAVDYYQQKLNELQAVV